MIRGGVLEKDFLRITNQERIIIDASVRLNTQSISKEPVQRFSKGMGDCSGACRGRIGAEVCDEACQTLVDIAEAYALFSTEKQFQKDLKKFITGHTQREALIQRLVKAGIWEDK